MTHEGMTMDDHTDGFTRWIFPALIVSLLLHAAVAFFAWNYRFLGPAPMRAVLAEAPPFQVQDVELPKTMKAMESEEIHQAAAPDAIKPPDEKIALEKMMAPEQGEAASPTLAESLLAEKPTLSEAMAKLPSSESLAAIERSDDSLPKALIRERTASSGDTSAETALSERVSAAIRHGPEAGGRLPGFSNLDDLLAQTGPLRAETAPILMPTDLLFDYDQASLRPEAMTSLQKLAALILRNPNARFVIEGHTDSFGTPEYNQRLSELRAESVKAGLVEMMRIDPARIETRGYGQSRLLAPATGTIDEQRLNRRVEIVVRP